MSIEELSIVATGPAHICVLAAMHAACLEDSWSAVSLQTLLGAPGVFGVIVLHSGQPAGFGLCRVNAGEGEVLTCGVMPQFRGRGVGRVVMETVLAEMAGRGAASVFLEVAEHNNAARHLYDRLGMRAVGRRPRYYRRPGGGLEDALILRRDS